MFSRLNVLAFTWCVLRLLQIKFVADISAAQTSYFNSILLLSKQHDNNLPCTILISALWYKMLHIFSSKSPFFEHLYCNCLSLLTQGVYLCILLAPHHQSAIWKEVCFKANQWPAWSYPIFLGQFWDFQFQINCGTPVGADWLHFHRASVACCVWYQLGILAWRQFP